MEKHHQVEFGGNVTAVNFNSEIDLSFTIKINNNNNNNNKNNNNSNNNKNNNRQNNNNNKSNNNNTITATNNNNNNKVNNKEGEHVPRILRMAAIDIDVQYVCDRTCLQCAGWN